jgi:UPF0755 protein
MVKKAILVVLVLMIIGAGAAYVVYARVQQPYRGYSSDAQEVEIPGGAGRRAIGDRLVDAGVVRDQLTYRIALWLLGADARKLKAGAYRFDRPMTPAEVLGKIARGDVDVVNVTFREGLTIPEMAAIFESQGLGSAADFREAASKGALISDLDPSAPDLEGYLFPETYAVSRHVNAPQLVSSMVDRFRHVLTPELQQAASEHGLSVRQFVTLASIVEKETGAASERPLVAAVYSNRLKIGMGLQCDPTVIYALQRAGRYDGNIHKDDLQIDSPYNTYRYPGLPPGPIAAPGKRSLEAAAHPADVDYLYFVSRNDGSHAFARTLEEHNRNVQKFQVEYFRQKRAAEQRQNTDGVPSH